MGARWGACPRKAFSDVSGPSRISPVSGAGRVAGRAQVEWQSDAGARRSRGRAIEGSSPGTAMTEGAQPMSSGCKDRAMPAEEDVLRAATARAEALGRGDQAAL